jgi:hypothetical protein
MMPTPPKLATWLLLTLGAGEHLEPAIGDLQERFRKHHSRWWYWRQIFLAIAVSATEEIRARKLLAVRAVLVGWLALFATVWFLGLLRYTLAVVANGGVDVAGYWIVLPTAYYKWTWQYGAYLTFGTNAVSGMVSGWIVGRFNAQRSGPRLVAFAASVLLWLLFALSLNPSSVRTRPTIYLLNTSALLLCIMCGGLIGVGLRRGASHPLTSRGQEG